MDYRNLVVTTGEKHTWQQQTY